MQESHKQKGPDNAYPWARQTFVDYVRVDPAVRPMMVDPIGFVEAELIDRFGAVPREAAWIGHAALESVREQLRDGHIPGLRE